MSVVPLIAAGIRTWRAGVTVAGTEATRVSVQFSASCFGAEAQAAMESDDYEAFLVAREKDILDYLRTYLQPAA